MFYRIGMIPRGWVGYISVFAFDEQPTPQRGGATLLEYVMGQPPTSPSECMWLIPGTFEDMD